MISEMEVQPIHFCFDSSFILSVRAVRLMYRVWCTSNFYIQIAARYVYDIEECSYILGLKELSWYTVMLISRVNLVGCFGSVCILFSVGICDAWCSILKRIHDHQT